MSRRIIAIALGWGYDGDEWAAYRFIGEQLATFGLTIGGVCFPFDAAETLGQNGDDAVLAKLAERGL